MMQYSPLLEKLLAGDFICPVSDEHYFNLLNDEAVRVEINHYFRPLNRRLTSNTDNNVWYLAYCDINPAVREQLSQQLKETVDSLIPLLKLLQLVQESLGQDRMLGTHDTLNRHTLAASIENNVSLREQLAQLVKTRLFQSQSEDVAGQLKLIFDRLSQQGYLLQPHKDRHIYRVTGKMDYLLDLTRFIQEEEQIQIEQPASTQEELSI